MHLKHLLLQANTKMTDEFLKFIACTCEFSIKKFCCWGKSTHERRLISNFIHCNLPFHSNFKISLTMRCCLNK